MRTEIKYIEQKSGFSDNGPAWIGLVSFSKSGKTIYFDGKAFQSLNGTGINGNYFDLESGDEYWISGIKKDMSDRHKFGGGKIFVEKRILNDYLKLIGKSELPKSEYEFYAIAIKIDGGGYALTGNYSTKDLKATVFFNSPYQIISWDIIPDWKGYYIIFSEDFYRRTLSGKRITEDFPFLLIDNAVPMHVSKTVAELYAKLFADMYFEFELNENSSKDIIANYLNILLHKVDRLYAKNKDSHFITQDERAKDLNLVSRFKTLLEISFQPGKEYEEIHPHQVQFYADKLNLHPNHLNAIVKRITEQSVSEHIYRHILSLAKSKLKNTDASIKEIAFELYYNYPNHFANFFKSHAQMTPSQFRKSSK